IFRRREGLRAVPPFIRQLRAGRWEVALDLGRGLKSAVLARATRAPVRIAFARRDAREGGWLLATRRLPVQGIDRPKLEQFLAFGDALGLPAAPVAFGLAPSGEEAAQAEALLAGLRRPVVAACVGSSCPARRWFPEPTAAVLNGLADRLDGSAILVGTGAAAALGAAPARARPG